MGALNVIELFAGVGGFRIGLEKANKELLSDVYEVVWSNQWEPSSRAQHASDLYVRAFGPKGHSNEDISTVSADAIPDADMLVGGFPCQDYSVATTLQRSGGLQGKKGVLWWEIHRILRDKTHKPQLLLLENVDRLLKSPSQQRGRDFAVMLASLADLGYAVEWRVLNAADYGMPQRRRRVFIIGYLEGSTAYEKLLGKGAEAWLSRSGTMARAFPVKPVETLYIPQFRISGNLVDVTNNFNYGKEAPSPFLNAGVMIRRHVSTFKVEAAYTGPSTTLGDVLVPEASVDPEFFINGDLEKWRFQKGAKVIERVSKETGHKYQYSEGGIAFPDPLDRPSRTIITGEGGPSPSRFKHVVLTDSGRYRRLVPVELERLNMFPDYHTFGVSDSKRAFLMGNALVTGIVTRIGVDLAKAIAPTFLGKPSRIRPASSELPATVKL